MDWDVLSSGPAAPAPPLVPPQPPPPQPPQPEPARPRVDLFDVQLAASAAVMLFSMGMLASGRGEPSVYLPVVSSVLSYWLPSPSRR